MYTTMLNQMIATTKGTYYVYYYAKHNGNNTNKDSKIYKLKVVVTKQDIFDDGFCANCHSEMSEPILRRKK